MNKTLSFEDIVEKYAALYRQGKAPDISEFIRQYPEYAEQLSEILPLLSDLEDLGHQNRYEPENIPDLTNFDFRLLKKIGAGGMGTVFEALQISLNRKVAVKLLSGTLIGNEEQRKQFEHEAQIIAMLHHPNIVKILNAKCTEQYCYYAMELIEGKNLNSCRFDHIEKIAEIGLQTAKALAYAHSCKIIHRDIKPANLLLDENGQIHIGDFGLALFLNDDPEHIKNADLKSGTLRYMAPEKLDHGENTFLTDQYSLGVTLYEITTRTPFVSAETTKNLIHKICSGNVPKLACKNKNFNAIINKSLNTDPAKRYVTMNDFAEDLQRFLHNEPVSARTYSVFEKYILWKKRNPGAAFFSLTAVICAIAFICALCFGYIQTSEALKLARKNAQMADATLSQVLSYIEEQTPSIKGSLLLDTLMPYYQEISRQQNQPDGKIARAHQIVGLYAMRSGNYQLAEKTYQKLFRLDNSAFALNYLADALEKQNQKKQADTIRKKIIQEFSRSQKATDKIEVVKALQAFPDRIQNENLAFEMIKSLLKEHPDNPEYLFRYAVILGNNPKRFSGRRIKGIEPNAIVLLSRLARQYPNNPDYGIAIMQLTNKKLRHDLNFETRDADYLKMTLKLSDQMLGRFPNMPKVVSAAIELKNTYIKKLRRSGNMALARKESENLLGMLEILFYNPETPNDIKELLIDMQLERLRLLKKTDNIAAVQDLKMKIQEELNLYNGPHLKKFHQMLINLAG